MTSAESVPVDGVAGRAGRAANDSREDAAERVAKAAEKLAALREAKATATFELSLEPTTSPDGEADAGETDDVPLTGTGRIG